MNRLRIAVLGLLTAVPALSASITIGPDQVVAPGSTIVLDLAISGLGAGVPPVLAAYDLTLSFDLAALQYMSAASQGFLGVPGVDTLYQTTLTGGGGQPALLRIVELSLLSEQDLQSLQPGAFLLDRITFVVVGNGTINITGDLSDAVGDPISASFGSGRISNTPETGTLFAMGAGLALVFMFRGLLRNC